MNPIHAIVSGPEIEAIRGSENTVCAFSDLEFDPVLQWIKMNASSKNVIEVTGKVYEVKTKKTFKKGARFVACKWGGNGNRELLVTCGFDDQPKVIPGTFFNKLKKIIPEIRNQKYCFVAFTFRSLMAIGMEFQS